MAEDVDLRPVAIGATGDSLTPTSETASSESRSRVSAGLSGDSPAPDLEENSVPGFDGETMSRLFDGTPREEINVLDRLWYENKKKGIHPTTKDDAREFVVVPPFPAGGLPPHLRPWTSVLDKWESASRSGKDRRKLPASLRNWAIWTVVGPQLPEWASAWILSLGVDPGPKRTDEGYTTVLLVAARAGWRPDHQEISLMGCFGEMLIHKYDGTCVRIPRGWWDKWAYGALAEGALYVVTEK